MERRISKSTVVFCTIVSILAVVFLGRIAVAENTAQSPFHKITSQTSAGAQSWQIELASDDQSRSKGLMFRKSMPKGQGMLFRFDDTQQVNMWMKNTFIPLDMVFMNEAGRVSHIHYSAVPQSLDIISSNGPVRYVLELNAGEAKATGLEIGSTLRHPWFSF